MYVYTGPVYKPNYHTEALFELEGFGGSVKGLGGRGIYIALDPAVAAGTGLVEAQEVF